MTAKRVLAFIIRSISNHPLVIGVALFLFLVRISFPSVFAWLVSASPVIISTTLLLGAILCYGEPNIPKIDREENDKKAPHELSQFRNGGDSEDLVAKEEERLTTEDNADSRRETSVASVQEIAPCPSVGGGEREIENEKGQRPAVRRGFSVRRLGRVVSNVGQCDGEASCVDRVENEGLNAEENAMTKKSCGWESESESNRSGNSSPDTSMANVIPMLDELHPLLDSEAPPTTQKSADNSYAPSRASSQHQESDDEDGDSCEEEAESKEEEEDEEEDAQEEKDDGSEGVVKWTADDQKNLMDLGTSELERNQRLENLIAKRRAKKFQRAETEKNLIDFDSNDPAPIVEELSRLLGNVPTITVTRRNPFDLPEEPDIPGSAPSILLPRQNPFDLPYEQEDIENSPIEESFRPPEPTQPQQKDVLFRRHESFSVGPSFGQGSSTRRPYRYKPYFVTERIGAEEPGFGPFERQLSEKSDSKASSSPKSESSSLAGEEENNKEGVKTVQQKLHQEGAFGSPTYYNAEHVEQDNQSSKVDTVVIVQEQGGIEVERGQVIDLNTSNVIEENHSISDMSEEEETGEKEKHEIESKLENIEENYDESDSTSSGADEKSLSMKIGEGGVAILDGTNDSLACSNDSVQSVLADSDLQSRAMERFDDCQAAEPVYDSSPSAIEKSLSNVSALNEALFYGGKGSFNSITSLASDMQVETSELDTTPHPVDKNFLSGDEGSISSNGSTGKGFASGSDGVWVASTNLSSVDKNESRSTEVTEIRELDVIRVGFSGFHEDFRTPMACIMPHSPPVPFAHHTCFASMMRTRSCEYSSMEEDVSLPSDGEGDEMTNDLSSSYRDRLVVADNWTSSASWNTQPISQQSFGTIEESNIDNLGSMPIPEEKLEEFKLREGHQNMPHHAANVSLNDLHIIKEHDVSLPDMEQVGSSSMIKSIEKTEGGENKISLLNKTEIGTIGNSGSYLQKPMESMELSSLSEMTPELEIKYDRDEHDPDVKLYEIYAEGKEVRGIAEALESEMNVSSNRSNELKSDQQEAKKVTDTVEDTPELTKFRGGAAKLKRSERHLDPEVLEVESAVKIQFTYTEAGTREISAEKLDGKEAIAGSSTSGASTSRKGSKEKKPGKSGSSSSSSLSSSASTTESD